MPLVARASERVGDGSALVVGEAIGGGHVGGIGGLVLSRSHEVDRRQDHQHRPDQREPAAGEEGAETGCGEQSGRHIDNGARQTDQD